MRPRERVFKAFRHVEPDRTPVFEKLIKSPIADELLGRPCAATNFDYQMRRLADGDWEGLQKQAARDVVDLSVLLGFDLVPVNLNGPPPAEEARPVRIGEGKWRMGGSITELLSSGCVRTRPAQAARPRSEEEKEADLRQWVLSDAAPAEVDASQLLRMRHTRDLMAQEGLDLAIFTSIYHIGVATLPPIVLRWFACEPELMHGYYRHQQAAALPKCRAVIEAGADIVGLGGDLASDHGPMISPEQYREFVMPYIREQARLCHELGALATNATDGDIWPIADDFLLGTEVDGFEEIDFVAGMDLRRLKREYGRRMTFIGNIDIRYKLTRGTAEDVRRHTIDCIEAGWGDGGHILMSSNCIHEDCKLELFLAYLQAHREYFGLERLDV